MFFVSVIMLSVRRLTAYDRPFSVTFHFSLYPPKTFDIPIRIIDIEQTQTIKHNHCGKVYIDILFNINYKYSAIYCTKIQLVKQSTFCPYFILSLVIY